MSEQSESESAAISAWRRPPPGRAIGKGHSAGDFLEAHAWDLLEERPGFLKVEASLPEHVRNPRGQLFGGFTPTYVDLVSLLTVRTGEDRSPERPVSWLATTNMTVDYFEPITGPRFVIEGTEERRAGRTHFVATRFFQNGTLAVFALTTMRRVELTRTIGDA